MVSVNSTKKIAHSQTLSFLRLLSRLPFQVRLELLRFSRWGDFEFDADSIISFLLIDQAKARGGWNSFTDECQRLPVVARKSQRVVNDVLFTIEVDRLEGFAVLAFVDDHQVVMN